MYFFNFCKQILKQKNVFALLYLVLNVFVIAVIVMLSLGTEDLLLGLGLGAVIYLISILLTLSPLGEWLLRLRHGCRRIRQRELLNRLDPLFREAERRAQRVDPLLTKEIRYFIAADATPNAFAIGRHTVCITEGLLMLPDEQIMAALAHELGHISHKDTDLLLVVTVGNMIITAYLLLLGFFLAILHFLCRIIAMLASIPMTARTGGTRRDAQPNCLGALVELGFRFLRFLLIGAFMWVWTRLGILLVLKTSRENEYMADEFAYNAGFGRALCQLLSATPPVNERATLFSALARTHPNPNDRIARLETLGAHHL